MSAVWTSGGVPELAIVTALLIVVRRTPRSEHGLGIVNHKKRFYENLCQWPIYEWFGLQNFLAIQ